jgi:hypothetical protein
MIVMLGILSSLFWLLLALLQFFIGLFYRAVMLVFWLLWPAAIVLLMAIALSPSAEAGWVSWLWKSDTRELERSLEVARDAAQTASEASQAQAKQAAAQAQQNSRVAETLGELSSERANLADHIRDLTDMGLRDSQTAAVLNASGPVLVCVSALLVAGLALWLANRPIEAERADLDAAMDLLVDEVAARRFVIPEISKSRGQSLELGAIASRGLTRNLGYASPNTSDSDESREPMPF